MVASIGPAAIAYLASLWASAAPTLTVYNGAPTTEITGDALMVGYNEEPNVPVVMGTQTTSSVGNGFGEDIVIVQSQLLTYSGDLLDEPALLVKASSQLDALFAAVRADPQLGGLVEQPGFALPSTYSIRRTQTDTGLVTIIDFAVQIAVSVWDYQ